MSIEKPFNNMKGTMKLAILFAAFTLLNVNANQTVTINITGTQQEQPEFMECYQCHKAIDFNEDCNMILGVFGHGESFFLCNKCGEEFYRQYLLGESHGDDYKRDNEYTE